MVSVNPINVDIETRHFMSDERQISIGIEKSLWNKLQTIANYEAFKEGWLGGKGSKGDYLNIFIIGLVYKCPKGIEPWRYITDFINSF
jgi:hypothetical protein